MPSIEKLYENLGKLFYAIAAADKVIHKEEIKTLERIVKEDWVKVDDYKDQFGTDDAFYIEIMFDWMQENSPPAYQAFYEFKEFKEDNEQLFTILSDAQTIAVVGASSRPEKPSHSIMKVLQDHGYRVIPVNPAFASLNLAQAVLVVGYEWFKRITDGALPFVKPERSPPAPKPATTRLRPTGVPARSHAALAARVAMRTRM